MLFRPRGPAHCPHHISSHGGHKWQNIIQISSGLDRSASGRPSRCSSACRKRGGGHRWWWPAVAARSSSARTLTGGTQRCSDGNFRRSLCPCKARHHQSAGVLCEYYYLLRFGRINQETGAARAAGGQGRLTLGTKRCIHSVTERDGSSLDLTWGSEISDFDPCNATHTISTLTTATLPGLAISNSACRDEKDNLISQASWLRLTICALAAPQLRKHSSNVLRC
jgi:hypothetical protein